MPNAESHHILEAVLRAVQPDSGGAPDQQILASYIMELLTGQLSASVDIISRDRVTIVRALNQCRRAYRGARRWGGQTAKETR